MNRRLFLMGLAAAPAACVPQPKPLPRPHPQQPPKAVSWTVEVDTNGYVTGLRGPEHTFVVSADHFRIS